MNTTGNTKNAPNTGGAGTVKHKQRSVARVCGKAGNLRRLMGKRGYFYETVENGHNFVVQSKYASNSALCHSFRLRRVRVIGYMADVIARLNRMNWL